MTTKWLRPLFVMLIVVLAFADGAGGATDDEAAALGTALTPFGAEKAGSNDGFR